MSPRGDALEHHGSAVRLALDRLGAAAPLVARLVERPVEGCVALRAFVPRLGVELLEDEAHGDGRLCGSEGVVVARTHLVDVAIEHVARGGAHFLGVEGVSGGPEAARLSRTARIGGDGGDAVAVGPRVRVAAIDAVDGPCERVIGIRLRPGLGRRLRYLHGGVVGEREDHLGGGAGVEHEGLEGRGHLARTAEYLAARGVVVDELAAVPEADDVPLYPVPEALGASEHGVVAVA